MPVDVAVLDAVTLAAPLERSCCNVLSSDSSADEMEGVLVAPLFGEDVVDAMPAPGVEYRRDSRCAAH